MCVYDVRRHNEPRVQIRNRTVKFRPFDKSTWTLPVGHFGFTSVEHYIFHRRQRQRTHTERVKIREKPHLNLSEELDISVNFVNQSANNASAKHSVNISPTSTAQSLFCLFARHVRSPNRDQRSVGSFRSVRLIRRIRSTRSNNRLADLSANRDGGYTGTAPIISRTQIGHVTLWHSLNDCNTLQHCSQPLRACSHNIA